MASGNLVPWAVAAALAVAGVAAADHLVNAVRPVQPAPLDPLSVAPGFGARTFADALAAANTGIEGKRYLLAREPDDWLRMEGLARALLARARLTASAGDMSEANRLLRGGIDGAPWPAGPTLSRAGAALLVHDLAGAEAALSRFDASVSPPSRLDALDARSMRCEIAFERGDVAQAQVLCAGPDDLSLELRRANVALAVGNPAEAARLAEIALRRPGHSPFQLARIMLQRTAIALAAGDWAAAGKWARAADRTFPGYWLAEAFVAQARALEGDAERAEAAYRVIAERTGNPDVYGALIVLAEERGDAAARERYLAAAGKSWMERVRQLPRTYGGHYGEYLALSGDIAGGLRAAGGDYRQRPYLQPMTDYVFVLDQAGQHARIVEVVERGERAGFRSATLLLAKSHALSELGRDGEAAEARAAALAINPRVEHPRQAFVHFRQD